MRLSKHARRPVPLRPPPSASGQGTAAQPPSEEERLASLRATPSAQLVRANPLRPPDPQARLPRPDEVFLVGSGVRDITGRFGEAMDGNVTGKTANAISDRVYAKAWALRGAGESSDTVVLVNLDVQGIEARVYREAAARLAQLRDSQGALKYPRFTESNLRLSASHTHSTPGQVSDNLASMVPQILWSPDSVERQIQGVVEASDEALSSMQRAVISEHFADMPGLAIDRSPEMSAANPPEVRERYPDGVDPEASVMRFDALGPSGRPERPMGVLAVSNVHPTALGGGTRSISGDMKGYEAELLEAAAGTPGFMAVSGSGVQGNASPRLLGKVEEEAREWRMWGYRHGPDNSKKLWGERLFLAHRKLYNDAAPDATGAKYLHGDVKATRLWVNWGAVELPDGRRTSPATLSGDTFKGTVDHFGPSVMQQRWFRRPFDATVRLFTGELSHLSPKAAIPTEALKLPGTGQGAVADVAPVHVVQIGNVPEIAFAGEMSAGLGYKVKALGEKLFPDAPHIRVQLYSGVYNHYAVTESEYRAPQGDLPQSYEAASTPYGPHQGDAMLHIAEQVIRAQQEGTPLGDGAPLPPLERKPRLKLKGTAKVDPLPRAGNFGDVVEQPVAPRPSGFRPYETARMEMYAGDPNRTLDETQNQVDVITVERKSPSGAWEPFLNERLSDTRWGSGRKGPDRTQWGEWTIDGDTPAGEYRLILQAVVQPPGKPQQTVTRASTPFTVDQVF